MKDQSEVSPRQGKSRDWIAVDQLVQVMSDNAPDEFERDVVRLAAECSAGPDPEITGGGPAWKEALDAARESLQAALLEDLDAKQPVVIDDTHPAQQSIDTAIEHADLNDFDRDRLREHLTELFVAQMQQARESERLIISDWLLARAERMGRGGSVIVEEQARALGSAAARLRKTLADEPPL
jgi:hypothetical protein